uniref:Prenyl transferase n=1 Tax=Dipterosiphonia australica TaxID=2007208 RepID=A0A1Z1MM19_9FLOR|nr:prenyl transferase [Dipterosiphonia australica]ARW66845.1 prenyl transferase [Dipterosiphonia australica]
MTKKYSLHSSIESIKTELKQLNKNLRKMIITENEVLYSAAEQLFNAKAKRIRPTVIFLVSKLINENSQISTEQKRLAEITEIIHTASLVHDDIIDNCDTRRGVETVHSIFNNKIAVLAGDFLFAQSSWYLANLNNLDVVKTISKIITDFAEGEVQQGTASFDSNISLNEYLEKSFYKTASLLACSCKATTILNKSCISIQNDFYLYGKHLGLAFQIIDDILDITGLLSDLGKPPGSDLKNGNLTAPLIFALTKKTELKEMINQEFQFNTNINEAINKIKVTNGIQKTRDIAEEHIQLAINILQKKNYRKKNKYLLSVTYNTISRIN